MEQKPGRSYINITQPETQRRKKYSPVNSRRSIESLAHVDKFIDSTTGDSEETSPTSKDAKDLKPSSSAHNHWARVIVPSSTRNEDNRTLAKTRPTDGDGRNSNDRFEMDQDSRSRKESVEDEDSTRDSDLEEVYLCNCWGTTRTLEPAMRYVPVFCSLFHLFNFLTFILALSLLGMGLWFRIDPKVYELHKYIETQNFTIAGWILLFGGFLACLMTIVGGRAASKKSISPLLFYCIIMTVLTFAFTCSLVLTTVHGLGISLERFMGKEMYDQIRRRAMSVDVDILAGVDTAQFLDFVQVKLRCCGSTDFRDYQKLGMVIPATCYTIAGNYINAPGCARALREMFDLRAGIAAALTASSIICQIMVIILGSLIVCSVYHYRTDPKTKSATSLRPKA